MGKTLSYDALDDDFVEDEYEMVGRDPFSYTHLTMTTKRKDGEWCIRG